MSKAQLIKDCCEEAELSYGKHHSLSCKMKQLAQQQGIEIVDIPLAPVKPDEITGLPSLGMPT